MHIWLRLRLPLLLVLLVTGGVGASLSAPNAGYVAGIWPVGLATGMALLVRRRRLPWLLVAVLAVATVTVLLAQPFAVAVGYAVGVTLEVLVSAVALDGLREPRRRRPSLHNDEDLRRWLAACVGSSFVGGLIMTVTWAATGGDRPVLVGAGVWIAHLASQTLLTPFFLRLPVQGAMAATSERVLQWLVIVVATPVLLLPAAAPGLLFLTIPILAWGALRVSPREALGQLVGVVTFAVALCAAGTGPLISNPRVFGVPDEIRGVLPSGYAITCAIIVVPLMLRVGEYIGSARDADAERYLVSNIVDSATGVAIIVTDEIGRIVRFNPGAERLLGYRADEVLGEFTPLLHTEAAIVEKSGELGIEPDFVSVVLALVGRPQSTLMRFRRKDGVERIHAMTLTQLTDPKGRPTGYLSTSEDVTETVEAQEALRAALAAETAAVERLQEVDAVKDAFVSTVSHELRTPMTSILGYLELLSDGSLGGLDPRQMDALSRVSSNSHRLLALINDLLTLSKVAEHGVHVAAETFDLRDAIGTARQVVAATAEQRASLTLDVDLPVADVPVTGDRDMLERVVVNLLSNAIKFTPDGGWIEVTLEGCEREAVVRVRDDGIGIPVEEQGALFTRFFRSSLAKGQEIQGSGLGLSITRSIVERHGGSIGVTSSAGAGTTVEVRLPLADGNVRGTVGNVQDSTTVGLHETDR